MNNIDRDKFISDIIKASGIHPRFIFNITIFGSRVYGTYDNYSDWDIIIVANNSVESVEIKKGIFNIHIYTPNKFKEDLNWHRINNLECIYAPSWAKLKEDINFESDFKLNKSKLRHAISHISSNSFVKSKKKLTLTNEYKTGIKSLFHSMRIPMFGIQIATNGRITNFECANWIWYKLNFKDKQNYTSHNSKWTWPELYNEFKLDYNSIMKEFRKTAAK